MADNDIFLKVEDLEVQYTSGGEVIHAVNGVSFQLERGKCLGLVGETGAGKTSIAKSILRVLPNPPAKITGGRIFLDGEDILQKPEEDMLKVRGGKVSMIFQDPMTALNPTMTVGSQIAEVIRLHNDISRREAEARAVEMLKMVGIVEENVVIYYENCPSEESSNAIEEIENEESEHIEYSDDEEVKDQDPIDENSETQQNIPPILSTYFQLTSGGSREFFKQLLDDQYVV